MAQAPEQATFGHLHSRRDEMGLITADFNIPPVSTGSQNGGWAGKPQAVKWVLPGCRYRNKSVPPALLSPSPGQSHILSAPLPETARGLLRRRSQNHYHANNSLIGDLIWVPPRFFLPWPFFWGWHCRSTATRIPSCPPKACNSAPANRPSLPPQPTAPVRTFRTPGRQYPLDLEDCLQIAGNATPFQKIFCLKGAS